MTKLEQAVAVIVNPKPWKHDGHGTIGCHKCGEQIYAHSLSSDDRRDHPPLTDVGKLNCPVPDTYTIPLVRKDNEDAYDLCLGQAMDAFRGLWGDLEDSVSMYDAIGKVGGTWNGYHAKLWVVIKATPAEIWEIVVNATKKETENE